MISLAERPPCLSADWTLQYRWTVSPSINLYQQGWTCRYQQLNCPPPGLLKGPRLGSGSRRDAQGLSHEAYKLEVWLFNHSDLHDLICTWVWLAQPLGLPLGPDPVRETASGRSSGGGSSGCRSRKEVGWRLGSTHL